MALSKQAYMALQLLGYPHVAQEIVDAINQAGGYPAVTPGTTNASAPIVVDANKSTSELHTQALYLGASGGDTLVTATAAELNSLHSAGEVEGDLAKLHNITASAAELNVLHSVTAGTAAASSGLVLGATKNIDTLLFTPAAPAAAGTNTQGSATALTADLNFVTGANGTLAVKLPVAVAGRLVIVVNTVAGYVLPVFPATGASINADAANASITIPAGGTVVFRASSSTQWYC
jgi:hypothetical protein